jgi:hypothetical protein
VLYIEVDAFPPHLVAPGAASWGGGPRDF